MPNHPQRWLFAIVILVRLAGAQDAPIERIAFGSCYKTDKDVGCWATIAAAKPDVLVLLGDNVYADTDDMSKMRGEYEKLAGAPGFADLRKSARLLATWDDHDFGKNDAGAEFPKRAEAQKELLDFLKEPADSPRRSREGVYEAYAFGPAGKRVQIILLDTRYHRSPLKKGDREDESLGRAGSYVASDDTSATMLGEAQWKWLEQRLREPAELRIIGSSIQVVAEDHRFERWVNLPHERERLLRQIRDTKAGPVIFISGDRHRSEISQLDVGRAAAGSAVDPGCVVLDVTSSALNNSNGRWTNEINRHRVGSQFYENNFGMIEIDWGKDDPQVALTIRASADGKVVIRYVTPLSALRAAR